MEWQDLALEHKWKQEEESADYAEKHHGLKCHFCFDCARKPDEDQNLFCDNCGETMDVFDFNTERFV